MYLRICACLCLFLCVCLSVSFSVFFSVSVCLSLSVCFCGCAYLFACVSLPLCVWIGIYHSILLMNRDGLLAPLSALCRFTARRLWTVNSEDAGHNQGVARGWVSINRSSERRHVRNLAFYFTSFSLFAQCLFQGCNLMSSLLLCRMKYSLPPCPWIDT